MKARNRSVTLSVHLLLVAAFMAAAMACSSSSNDNPPNPNPGENTTEEVSYMESHAVFCNPDRGFYTHLQFGSKDKNALTAATVKKHRESGISLLLNIYYMQDFRDKPISAEFLARIRANMDALREGGSKTVLRFAYTESVSDKPWDAPWDITKGHIKQLAPIFTEYSDVIAVLEAGFVGVWGEWYYTDNYNMDPDKDGYEPRKQVIEALLAAMPKDRMVSIRTPKAKVMAFGITTKDSITLETAYNKSDMSRMSGHNDCFLADETDSGTFANRGYRRFWETESRYMVMGGETCKKSSYSICENALNDLKNYHWSYLNINYQPAVISQWETEKCLEDIKKFLGYRFVLKEGSFAKKGEIGNAYKANVKLYNAGWAAPYNLRSLEVVLVSTSNKSERYKAKLKDDPRFWFANQEIDLELEFGLPTDMTSGKYTIYINLPDPHVNNASRSEYSIRMANDNVWDMATGYNKLYDVVVDAAAKSDEYKGDFLIKF